ncbi:MAG: S46 family peptidase [Paludibacteraceae bacterium]|nr:S46 family peptidase [Paludibacteraceae bacterium]
MSKKVLFNLILLVAIYFPMSASEGMWILPNIPDSVVERMEENGLDVEISRIYKDRTSSIKDAVVYLTSGYTGTIISEKGLLIAPIKAVENRLPDTISYAKGYKSPSIYKEVSLNKLGAWILQSTQDVTYRIIRHTSGIESESRIKQVVDSVSRVICRGEVLPQGYIAQVEGTSTGKYYLYVYKCYNDVRLAYLPPASIANDSLKTDRHSADFVILRIYSNRDNEPSYYDQSNMAYQSHKVSLSDDDYKEGDFVFSLGFPNKTNRSILSSALQENIAKLEAQNVVCQLFDSIGYANLKGKIEDNQKQIDVAVKSGVVEDKKNKEYEFLIWAANHPDFQTCLRYGNVIPFIDTLYATRLNTVREHESITEILQKTNTLMAANVALDINDDNAEELFNVLNTYFVEYDDAKERKAFKEVLNFIEKNFPTKLTDRVFEIERTKYKGDREKYIEDIFEKSIITDEKRFVKYLDKPTELQLKEDILVSFVMKLNDMQELLYSVINSCNIKVAHLTRLYMEGMTLVNPSAEGMPDANYTFRMSSGSIKGYAPDDITHINATSNLSGMFNYGYTSVKCSADSVLTTLYKVLPAAKKQRITFLADCDMAIGRTGYGVYDYNGDLLGMVIGWNREAENNAFVYNPEYHRFIVLDIKYVMFILNAYASLNYVVKEISR